MFLLDNLFEGLLLRIQRFQFVRHIAAAFVIEIGYDHFQLARSHGLDRDAHEQVNERPSAPTFDAKPDGVQVRFRGVAWTAVHFRQPAFGEKSLREPFDIGQFWKMFLSDRKIQRHLDFFAETGARNL